MSDFDDKRPEGEAEVPVPESEAPRAGVPEEDVAQTLLSVPPDDRPGIAMPEAAPTVPPVVNASPVAPAPPRPRTVFLARLVQALWLGAGVFMAIAAIAVFRTLAPTDAADGVGAMLARWHYIAILAPVALLLIEWRRQRTRMVLLLSFAILVAVLQIGADLRIRRIRQLSPVPISSLDRSDPIRRRFGALHGFSSMMLLVQIAAAIGVVAAEPDPE